MTKSEIETDSRPLHPLKALSHMLVIKLGIETAVRPLQCSKAPPIIFEIFSGIEKCPT